MRGLSRFDNRFDPGVGWVDELILNLAPPVSANNMNKVGRGRLYRSTEYKQWLAECRLDVGSNPGRVREPFTVELILIGGKGWIPSRRDIDNIIKPTADYLRSAGIIENDTCAFMRSVSSSYFQSDKNGRARLWVRIKHQNPSNLPDWLRRQMQNQ